MSIHWRMLGWLDDEIYLFGTFAYILIDNDN